MNEIKKQRVVDRRRPVLFPSPPRPTPRRARRAVARSSGRPTSLGGAMGAPPGVHSVWIINKSGGLVFQRNYADIPAIDTNETLRLASIWHSLHAISVELSPVEGCTGIELLETEYFDLHCMQTLTGTRRARSSRVWTSSYGRCSPGWALMQMRQYR